MRVHFPVNDILNLNDHVDIHNNAYQSQAGTNLRNCLHEQYISPTNEHVEYTCQQEFILQDINSVNLLTLGNFFNGIVP